MEKGSFTGYKRAHKTRTSVLVGEKAMRGVITVGGIGVIAAVFLVFVFLTSVVFPLFQGASVEPEAVHSVGQGSVAVVQGGAKRSYLTVDEFLIAALISDDGGRQLKHVRLDTGEVIGEFDVLASAPTVLSYTQADGWIAAGFSDGTTSLGQIRFETDFFELDDPRVSALSGLEVGEVGVFEGNAAQRTEVGQIRVQRPVIEVRDAVSAGGTAPIRLIDKTITSAGPIVATYSDDGILRVNGVSERRNILTGVVTTTLSGGEIDLSAELAGHPDPTGLLITARGGDVFLVWRDGYYVRVGSRDLENMEIAERGWVLDQDGSAEVTYVTFLLGRGNMAVGDSLGRVRTWFLARDPESDTPDALSLVNASEFEGPASPVTAIASSSRKRVMAVGHGDGSVETYYVTSSLHLGTVSLFEGRGVDQLAVAPKDDGVAALSAGNFGLLSLEAKHPEASFRSIFTPVWYEGNPEPQHSWQSSSGNDTFEPKYGLIPLIFGTLKATFYSMLFGVPIALLAAIYTSEFLNPKLRGKIKPAVEMMASLPSVVLGFLAGLVFAPFVENVVPTVLVAFVVIPGAFVLAGYVYQLLPRKTAIILSKYRFIIAAFLVLPLGIGISILLGPAMERVLFNGDIKGWLDGRVGDGGAGWILMLLPGSAVLVFLTMAKRLGPYLRDKYRSMPQTTVAALELGKFVGGALVTIALAVALARILVALGIDSRQTFPLLGPVFGTYIQRNSLIVGFIMGFAIIPIIFTISDDALKSVPDHLRSASLASGATQWQTTIRVVIPTAMSGLFSAIMIGLGRAVGETMIVLMATGNTPIMEWNIFNGFRTLAANIAVELPEAAVDSTHYRVLFLAALCLFVMTFAVNTVAEVIRQRFRKRAYQL